MTALIEAFARWVSSGALMHDDEDAARDVVLAYLGSMDHDEAEYYLALPMYRLYEDALDWQARVTA